MRSGPVRSGAVMSCDEQWSCDEWGVRSGAVMSWYVISCDELCCDVYCACHHKAAVAPVAPTRAAAPPGGSVYCTCHAKGSPQPQRRPRAPQLLQEALCTAPAMRKAAAAPAAPTRRSFLRRLCVLHLPRKRQPRPQRRPRAPQLLQEALCTAPAMRKAAAAPAAPTRAAAPPGGSVYCVCHAKGSRGPSGAHARRSSSRRLCVLRLPRQRQPGSYLYSEWMSEGVSEWEWVSVSECEWVCVSEWVSEGRGGGGRRRAAGSKRKTRTPHSDVGNNVLHLENNHFGSWFSLTTFSVNDCSDRHFSRDIFSYSTSTLIRATCRKTDGTYTRNPSLGGNNNWLEVSIPKNISQIGSSSQLLGKIKNVPNHQPDYVLSCALDPPWKRTGGYLKNGPPPKWFSHKNNHQFWMFLG